MQEERFSAVSEQRTIQDRSLTILRERPTIHHCSFTIQEGRRTIRKGRRTIRNCSPRIPFCSLTSHSCFFTTFKERGSFLRRGFADLFRPKTIPQERGGLHRRALTLWKERLDIRAGRFRAGDGTPWKRPHPLRRSDAPPARDRRRGLALHLQRGAIDGAIEELLRAELVGDRARRRPSCKRGDHFRKAWPSPPLQRARG